MKKLIMGGVILGLVLLFGGNVQAQETLNVYSADLSNETVGEGSSSAILSNGVVTLEAHGNDGSSNASESRITIQASDVGITTLSDLESVSWGVTNGQGYAPHLDVFLDNGMVLVFEHAKVSDADCDNAAVYPTDSYNTFAGKGTVNADAKAWILPGPPGGCATPEFVANWHTLSEFKTGSNGIDGSTGVSKLEIEVDGWGQFTGTTDSNADISNIIVNGNEYFVSIQDAIVAATDGDTINVAAGTYPESVLVNESITLKGPNAGVAGNGDRDPEAIIDGNVNITADDVILEGFAINGRVDSDGSHTIIQHNKIVATNMNGIVVVSPTDGGAHILYNEVTATGNVGGQGLGIYMEGDNATDYLAEGNTVTASRKAIGFGKNAGGIITKNVLEGTQAAVEVFDAGLATVTLNSLLGMVINAENNAEPNPDEDELNAEKNWWGTAIQSEIKSKINGDVSYSPWYTDPGRTTLGFSLEEDSEEGTVSTTITGTETLTGTSSGEIEVTVTAEIPAGTIITSDSGWDGVIAPPTTTESTVTVTGFTTEVTSAITIGSNLSDLFFDKAVKLTFAGQAGKRIGWYNAAGTFSEITADCLTTGGDDQAVQTINLGTGASCKMNVGGDLVVYTKHFSTFITYTQTAVPPSSGSRTVPCAPGQTEFCAPTLPAQASPVAVEALGQVLGATTGPIPGCGNRTTGFSSATGQSCVGNVVGQVFGAERFNFTHFLKFSPSSYKFSLQGGEVTELQKFLNTLGHNCGTVDGKFGPKTKACIVKFQLANGLKGDGIVGVLTRAILNK